MTQVLRFLPRPCRRVKQSSWLLASTWSSPDYCSNFGEWISRGEIFLYPSLCPSSKLKWINFKKKNSLWDLKVCFEAKVFKSYIHEGSSESSWMGQHCGIANKADCTTASTWTLGPVLAASLWIQVPANSLGRTMENGQVLWAALPMWKIWKKLWAFGFNLIQPQLLQPFAK